MKGVQIEAFLCPIDKVVVNALTDYLKDKVRMHLKGHIDLKCHLCYRRF